MIYYGCRSCIIIIRKIKPSVTLLPSFSTSITCLSHSNFQTILKTKFIKRDFHSNVNNYNVIKPIMTREERDTIDNERLQKLLEDSDKEKKYKLLQYEIEYLRHLNELLPQNIRPRDWICLINLPSKTQQRKYLKFLFVNEMKLQNAKQKKKTKVQQSLEKWNEHQQSFSSGLTYGLGKTTLFMRFYDKSMDHFFNYNLILSMLFEPKIVFDCGYEENMSLHEINNCAKQLLISFVVNRTHRFPAHLYLCNASKDSKLLKQFSVLMPNLYDDDFPMDCTSKSYIDIFDRDKLIYLTPHCREQMTSYDPDKIYIIGGLVDKTHPKPYSLARAKKEGIQMQKLPLDTYCYWRSGSGKCLTLNQVLSILLDMKYSKDWMSVLQTHVPGRKIVQDEVGSVIRRK